MSGNACGSLRPAAAYIRVSTEDQTEYSPDAQLSEIRKYAAREGFIILPQHIYVDEGISGKDAKKRDAFNLMISASKTRPKPFDAILVWKFSRFARSREDSVIYKSLLRRELGIDVISVTEPLSDEKTSVILEAVIEAMDEYYSLNLSEEVKRGMTEAARRGKLQGTASFGYRSENGALVPDNGEAALVREIFTLFAEGESFFSIAKRLNDTGARTRRGNAFENRTIEYILRNPVYIGKMRWNPTGPTRRDFSNPGIITADSSHMPLVDAELWEAVQRRLAEIKPRRKPHGRPAQELRDWPSGLVRCSACKSFLIHSAPHYYKCGGYARGRCAASQHIPSEVLKEAIIARLEDDASSAPSPSYDLIRTRDAAAERLRIYEKALAENERRASRLREAYLAGAESLASYVKIKASLDEDAVRVRELLSKEISLAAEDEGSHALKSSIEAALSSLARAAATTAEKHEAAASIIREAVYDKQSNLLTIYYRFSL